MMDNLKVVVTSPSFSKHEGLTAELKQHFPNTKLNEAGTRFNQQELVEFIGDADAVVLGLEKVNSEVLDMCPQLKMISKYGVGTDNIDKAACEAKGIRLGWTGGVNRLSVAELALSNMLSLVRNSFAASNQLKSGTWKKRTGRQLSGLTVGIIGVGFIGKELVRLLKPFQCKILVNDVIDQSTYYTENGLIESSKEEIFEQADIVTIHTPLDDSTRNMIGTGVLKKMKDDAILINTARGGIVIENDLKEALKGNYIGGAAIDAFDIEPATDTELLTLPNFLCTPHIGGSSVEAIEAMGKSAIHHLKEHFKK